MKVRGTRVSNNNKNIKAAFTHCLSAQQRKVTVKLKLCRQEWIHQCITACGWPGSGCCCCSVHPDLSAAGSCPAAPCCWPPRCSSPSGSWSPSVWGFSWVLVVGMLLEVSGRRGSTLTGWYSQIQQHCDAPEQRVDAMLRMATRWRQSTFHGSNFTAALWLCPSTATTCCSLLF